MEFPEDHYHQQNLTHSGLDEGLFASKSRVGHSNFQRHQRLDEIALSQTESDAWHGFLKTHTAIVKTIDSLLESTHGLPLSSYEVLLIINSAPGTKMRMAELAESAMLSRSGLTRLIDRLESMGLITRTSCTDDARGAYAELTPRGRGILAQVHPTYINGIREHFLDHFSEDDLTSISECWDRCTCHEENHRKPNSRHE